jgi:hypothetical protein
MENILLFDGAKGIYIPQFFCQGCNPEKTNWIWDYENLSKDLLDKDSENHAKAWKTVLDTACYYDPETGEKYHLYQDGDLWAVPFS